MHTNAKPNRARHEVGENSAELESLIERYGSDEFTQALTDHFHRAKRAALAEQNESEQKRVECDNGHA